VTGAGPEEPSGTVTFLDGTTVLGTARINGDGTASLVISTIGAGTHSLVAHYNGDANYVPSSTAFPLTVAQDGSSVDLKSSRPSALVGAPVTFTATVRGVATGLPVTSGMVTFFDGTTAIGSATLDATGHAQLTSSFVTPGTHSINASFSGNPNYLPGASEAISQRIRTAPDSSADGSTVGDASIVTRDDHASSAVGQVTPGISTTSQAVPTGAGLTLQPPRVGDGSFRKLNKPAGSTLADVIDQLFSSL
jgi:hypothetical protein